MNGQKREKKDEEKYDSEEEKLVETSKKLKTVVDDMPGIPIAPLDTGNNKQSVIFVLENASLELGKVGKTYQLLRSDEHATFLRNKNRNPADYRPDIAFQAIQTILDSRVNKTGRLKALYVSTQQGDLIEIKPHVHMPRTYKSFAGLMAQLLHKHHINAAGSGERLLQKIKNPVTKYLPSNSRKIGLSHSSEKLVDMHNCIANINEEMDIVFVLGAMAYGKIDKDYVEDYVSISECNLSAAYAISMITNAVERKFKIM
ncbi:ribosomal RNA small subunit methyltransferase NEP1-like [Salvia splendens]|uniref:ribosomal RNA small subunit methyltransferase NEP1-like n=1 Tax=Salvia splendens TaxID=180675 RepID=UPI001C254F68|nr:ribosomal RNA small subunit methyltransferase NEP1-like [Salvia splendens]